MKAVSRRHKLIGGVLGIVSAAWAIDMLSGGPGPSPAEAGPSPALTSGPAALPPDPADLEALIEALQRDQGTRSTLPFEQVKRDLFVPTERFEAVLVPVVGEDSEGEPEGELQPAEGLAPFETRHELQGVLTGRVPLALIDGLLLREGAEIDGYRLVEIHADFVVLRQGREQVTLRVTSAGDR